MATNGYKITMERRMSTLEAEFRALKEILTGHMETEEKNDAEVRAYLQRMNWLLITTLLALAVDFGSRLIPQARAFF